MADAAVPDPSAIVTCRRRLLLLTLDPAIARKTDRAVVVVSAQCCCFGIRYSGEAARRYVGRPRQPGRRVTGATSVGAPPVILYLLSGPDRSP